MLFLFFLLSGYSVWFDMARIYEASVPLKSFVSFLFLDQPLNELNDYCTLVSKINVERFVVCDCLLEFKNSNKNLHDNIFLNLSC